MKEIIEIKFYGLIRLNYIKSIIMFGPSLKLNTKTQLMVWTTLTRLANYWSLNMKTPPTEEQILDDRDTIRFLLNMSRLCFNLIKTDQVRIFTIVDIVLIFSRCTYVGKMNRYRLL